MDQINSAPKEGQSASEVSRSVHGGRFFGRGKMYWKRLGPGIITGAADDDPSGIATYSQAGAGFGFQMLWLSVYTFPLMAVVQEMCSRIALATGRGLAANMRLFLPKYVLYGTALMLFAANTFNIGADLGAMAEALTLIFPGIPSFLYLIVIAGVCLCFEIFANYASIAKYLKWLTFALLAYIVTGLIIKFSLPDLLRFSLVPHISFTKDFFFMITAVLGTTISPYLFFWQTSQEVEEENEKKNRNEKVDSVENLKMIRYDVWFGMFFSNLVMFFIIAVCGDTLFKAGITSIATAGEAAEALRPISGNLASLIFTLGIVGTGFLAIPVLAGSSAYALSESFGWKEGLYKKFRQAKLFYLTIIASVVLGLIQNFFHIGAMKTLVYSALLNGLIAPFILVSIVVLARKKEVMGQFVNSKGQSFVAILTTAIMFLVAGATIFTLR